MAGIFDRTNLLRVEALLLGLKVILGWLIHVGLFICSLAVLPSPSLFTISDTARLKSMFGGLGLAKLILLVNTFLIACLSGFVLFCTGRNQD